MPVVLFPGERFSVTELRAACMDGLLVPVGLGYVPADAPTPPPVRARSLAPLVADGYAFVRHTAAWVHGAADVLAEPFDVQRAIPARTTRLIDARISYVEQELPAEDAEWMGGVRVATAARTLADLARIADDDPAAMAAVLRLAAEPDALPAAIDWFRLHRRRPGAVAARELLRSLAREPNATLRTT